MGRPRTKRHILVENAACLDATALLRGGWLRRGQLMAGTAQVVHHPIGTTAGVIFLTARRVANDRACIRVRFTVGNVDCEQTIALTAVARLPFGGQRWFFICPQRGARACRLFLPAGGDRFLSREAHGLRYAVEHETREDADVERVVREYRKIAGELPSVGALTRVPPRPKGMHQQRYDWLKMKLLLLQERVIRRLAEALWESRK